MSTDPEAVKELGRHILFKYLLGTLQSTRRLPLHDHAVAELRRIVLRALEADLQELLDADGEGREHARLTYDEIVQRYCEQGESEGWDVNIEMLALRIGRLYVKEHGWPKTTGPHRYKLAWEE